MDIPEKVDKEMESKIRNLDDNRLLEILKHKSDFTEEAVSIAIDECKKRAIAVDAIESNILPTSAIKIPGHKLVLQHPSVINTAIALILLTDVISLILCAYAGEYTPQDIGSFFWDLFFCYHLSKMKEWARKWSIGRLVFGAVVYIPTWIYQDNILGAIWTAVFVLAILFLLLGKGSRKKAVVVATIYLVFLSSLIFYMGFNIFQDYKQKGIINKIPVNTVYKFDKHIMKLPSNYWRVLDVDMAKHFIGEAANIVTTFLATSDNANWAELFVEDISVDEIDLKKARDYIKSTFKEVNYTEEKISDDSVILSGKFIENNVSYYFVGVYKTLGTIGITWYFFGYIHNYEKIHNDILFIIENTKEISLKQRLGKISPAEVFKKYSDAVVLIRIYDKDGKITAFGSGINIIKEGAIITNLHVILAGKYIDVKFLNHGIYEDVYIAGLSKNGRDLVILKINGKDLPCIDKERSVETEIGDKVIVISNPEGMLNSLSEGIVSGIRYDENNNILYQVTAPISAGSSGGAVFNEYSELLGVCSSTIESGQNLNFYIPIEEINNFEIYEAKDMFTLDQLVNYLEGENEQEQQGQQEQQEQEEQREQQQEKQKDEQNQYNIPLDTNKYQTESKNILKEVLEQGNKQDVNDGSNAQKYNDKRVQQRKNMMGNRRAK